MSVADQTGCVHEALLPCAADQPAPPLTSVSTDPPCPPARSPPGPFRDSFLPVVCSLLRHHHCFFLCWDRSHQSTDGKQNLPCFPTPCLLSLLCSVLFCSCLLRPDWGLRRWRFSLTVLRPVSVACRWTAPSQLVPHDLASVCTRPWYLCIQSPLVTKTPVLLESGSPRGLHFP